MAIILIPAMLHLQINIAFSGQELKDDTKKTCQQLLDTAEEYYFEDNMDRAIELVLECLSQPGVKDNLRVRAYTILARIYLVREEPAKTKEMIRKILGLDPSYQPTIEQETPRYVSLVHEVRKTWQPSVEDDTILGLSPWVWVGAGVAATTAIVVIVVSGSSSDTQGPAAKALPKPPDFPE